MSFDTRGLVNFQFDVREVVVDCWLDYESGEPRTWDEPGWDESIQLHHAFVEGVDIVNLLDDSIIKEIEEKALINLMEYER